MPTHPKFVLEEALEGLVDDFAAALDAGLSGRPKSLPCRFFYDEEGSRLFEEICTLPEYYPTRAEAEILAAHAGELAERFAGHAWIELGSGSSEKTELVLRAACARSPHVLYAPIDICADVLVRAGERLTDSLAELEVHAVAARYREGLPLAVAATPAPRVALWLGSNVGNFTRAEAADMLRGFRARLGAADAFLLGADLRKAPEVLERAYDDPRGVTARFNLNLLARANRELGADFDLAAFRHRAVYDVEGGVVRMYLDSLRDQTVSVRALGKSFRFAAGEAIHTEDSTKYSPDELESLARAAGFVPDACWTDAAGRFALALWRRGSDAAGTAPA